MLKYRLSQNKENKKFNIKISMIYRAKVGLQNIKQLGSYSPMHSPSNNRKGSALKQTKFSPKPSQRENKQNLDQKESKTERTKEQKYFKIPKQEPSSSAKKANKPPKISISISLNDDKKKFQEFDCLNLLNIQTPKFKCSSNKIDDRCKTQNFVPHQNYFSFGQDFRQNIKISSKNIDQKSQNRQKKSATPLREINKNQDQELCTSQKFTIDSVKKKQKNEKVKQGQDKFEQRFILFQKESKDSKFKKDRQIFSFKK